MEGHVPFMFSNAAGHIYKTPEQAVELAKVPLTNRIVLGSFTVKERSERTGGTAFATLDDGTASNNLNLPNGGLSYLMRHGPDMVRIIHDAGKEAIMSGAPFSPEEDGILAEAAFEAGFDVYQSNRGCPNTEATTIISYDHELMEEHDEHVARAINGMHWQRKVSPYANPEDRVAEANLFRKSTARELVACNTFPRVRLRDKDGKPIITAFGTDGLGGMSGTQFKVVALANAEHFCELLAHCDDKKVIGVGGISSGDDVEDYLRVGCFGVEVGAALFRVEDPRVLQQIGHEWAERYTR